MLNNIDEFKEQYPSLASYWRSIILFGRNVASYKFALAESLLEIAQTGKSVVTLEDLAAPFSKHICEHLAVSPKQATSQRSQFLDACRKFNTGEISYNQLLAVTVAKGFNYVIDAFHMVNNSPISVQFYTKDYTKNQKKIILTDDLYRLKEMPFFSNLEAETESRWNLVETAWGLGISRNLLSIQYDSTSQFLVVPDQWKRKSVTSAKSALNGYQKGKCFYCFDDISITTYSPNACDVDHFFPYILQPQFPDVNLNGVWNLVLTCRTCNRGEHGKFAKIPAVKYLSRLHKRNEYLISSHHPLRETIISQTGKNESERRSFLKMVDQRAVDALIHRWEIKPVAPAIF